ncbi:MAG: hypothetical protein ABIK92_11645 [Pseudomonadota bacterium]
MVDQLEAISEVLFAGEHFGMVPMVAFQTHSRQKGGENILSGLI